MSIPIFHRKRARNANAVGLDSLLADVGERRVGASEGDDRGLAEEDPLLDDRVLPAENGPEDEQRPDPERETDRDHPQRPGERGADAVDLRVGDRRLLFAF
ncbi:MAG TPA: hypothetical protein VJ725_02810 [Thermoanaerobaculia bacterium]|nr:hypothetical protein [Thermoanaerobaculia bacterium]